jgi:hypothetical protein
MDTAQSHPRHVLVLLVFAAVHVTILVPILVPIFDSVLVANYPSLFPLPSYLITNSFPRPYPNLVHVLVPFPFSLLSSYPFVPLGRLTSSLLLVMSCTLIQYIHCLSLLYLLCHIYWFQAPRFSCLCPIPCPCCCCYRSIFLPYLFLKVSGPFPLFDFYHSCPCLSLSLSF